MIVGAGVEVGWLVGASSVACSVSVGCAAGDVSAGSVGVMAGATVAMVVAVRQALDYRSTLRAFGVCLIGWLIQLAIIALIFVLFGRPQGG